MMQYERLIVNERLYLAKLLRGLTDKQWHASTLCEGWDVEDLVSHIIVRDRGSVLARVGIVFQPLHGQHEAAIKKQKSAPHQVLIEQIEHIPWWGKKLSFNVIEFFVHNEDILRGRLKKHREVSDELYAGLAALLPGIARLALRKLDAKIRVTLVDAVTGELVVARRGRGADPHELTLTAEAPEFVMLFMGRGRVAHVTVDGDREALDAYKHAQIGL